MMWKEEQCMIVNFLECLQEMPSKENQDAFSEEIVQAPSSVLGRIETKVPSWLKTATPESIAKEILEFKDEQSPKNDGISFHLLSNLFWSKKGVEKFFLPPEIELKIRQADIEARLQLQKEDDEKKKAMLLQEKEELPSLVCQCVDWARVNSLKRLTLSDIDTFILEKDIDILKETKRALYSMTNVKLKSGK
ncbi:MAG: hypothetical protein NWF04_02895 [Candidatus Bathyarchaeota archaeon]|nr:hypothetical protein [Candidatus Bathyarchaeota archaeon]